MAGERQWCVGNYGTSGYWVCSHTGCSKKVRDHVTDHDCCGGVRHDLEHRYREQRRAERAAGVTYAEPSTREEVFWFGVFATGIVGVVTLLDMALGGRRR